MDEKKELSKEELMETIATLIESDPEAEPMSLEILGFMDVSDLQGIYEGLLKNKANRPQEHEAWFNELVDKCSK